MEHSIGVGAIVGLTFASSIYVWNNDRFNSTQKTLLLICIIFPPAQWLGILIVSIYNSNVESNTPERKIEKKLDSTISNLTELKEKGILTEEEYKTKVGKIALEKTEQNLKNSLEYKQLKSLFENGILTKEEFENKIRLLQSVSEKEVDTKEINKIIKSVNNTYIDSTKEKIEDKKENSTPVYIGSILFFIVLIGGTILFSNNSSNNIEVPPNPPEEIVIDTTAIAIDTLAFAVDTSETTINTETEPTVTIDTSAFIIEENTDINDSNNNTEKLFISFNGGYVIDRIKEYNYDSNNSKWLLNTTFNYGELYLQDSYLSFRKSTLDRWKSIKMEYQEFDNKNNCYVFKDKEEQIILIDANFKKITFFSYWNKKNHTRAYIYYVLNKSENINPNQ